MISGSPRQSSPLPYRRGSRSRAQPYNRHSWPQSPISVPGLEGVVAFTTDIAEPDKNGGNLRFRGVDIEDLVENEVTFADVWALLVDGRFGDGLPPAEPFPPPIHTGDVRVDVQAALAMLAPIWGYQPLLDIDDANAWRTSRAPR